MPDRELEHLEFDMIWTHAIVCRKINSKKCGITVILFMSKIFQFCSNLIIVEFLLLFLSNWFIRPGIENVLKNTYQQYLSLTFYGEKKRFGYILFCMHWLFIQLFFFVVFLHLIVAFPGSFISTFHSCILTEFSLFCTFSLPPLSNICSLLYTLPFLQLVCVTFSSPLRQPNTLLLCCFIPRRSSSFSRRLRSLATVPPKKDYIYFWK